MKIEVGVIVDYRPWSREIEDYAKVPARGSVVETHCGAAGTRVRIISRDYSVIGYRSRDRLVPGRLYFLTTEYLHPVSPLVLLAEQSE